MTPSPNYIPIREALDIILADVCERHRCTPEEIRGRTRHKDIVAARRELCIRAREAGASYPVIGRFVGRDHSSVMSLVRGKWRHAG